MAKNKIDEKPKGRYKGQKWAKVSRQKKSRRRKKHEVKRYTMKCSKPYRIPAHVRRPRRTDKQIEASNKRKQRKEEKKRGRKNKQTKKQKKQKTLSQSSKGTPKKYFKQVEKNQSKIKAKGK